MTTKRPTIQSRTLRHLDGRKGHKQEPTDGKARASSGPTADPKVGAEPDAGDDLKSLPLAEVQRRLDSSPKGLTQAEAVKRLVRYGPIEIEAKKANQLLKLLKYF
jgi:hypothetical protein